MNIQIMIGGIGFRFDSDFEIIVEEALAPFLCTNKEVIDVEIALISDKNRTIQPRVPMSGEDLLLEYYHEGDRLLCLAKGSVGRYLSTVVCDHDFTDLKCYLHDEPIGSMQSLGVLLRLLPMCAILQKKGVSFFHASQIAAGGKGILFTAPSGTGKTTQAKLWKEHRGAEMICNDRTLIRNGMTYGYPVDGSEPVGSDKIFPLGAIVLLEQGKEDVVQKLRPREALLKLYPQLIMSFWDPISRILATEQLISITKEYPVYLFRCTPEKSAVECLEQQFKIDGVV